VRHVSFQHQIRADFDTGTIVVYQAYSPAVADPALGARTVRATVLV